MYLYVIRMSPVCTRISSVCYSFVLVCHPYVTPIYSHVIHMSLACTLCHPYVTCMCSYVTNMSLVCTCMSFVCHSLVLVCHPYDTRMYSYVIRMLLVYTCMSFVCHSYVLVSHPYVTRLLFYHEPFKVSKLRNIYYIFYYTGRNELHKLLIVTKVQQKVPIVFLVQLDISHLYAKPGSKECLSQQ